MANGGIYLWKDDCENADTMTTAALRTGEKVSFDEKNREVFAGGKIFRRLGRKTHQHVVSFKTDNISCEAVFFQACPEKM